LKVEPEEYMRVVNAQLTLMRKNSFSESQWPAIQLYMKVRGHENITSKDCYKWETLPLEENKKDVN